MNSDIPNDERLVNAIERVADRLEQWDAGGGLNLVAGTTLEGILGTIADSAERQADALEQIAQAVYLEVDDYALTGPAQVPLAEVIDGLGRSIRASLEEGKA